MNNISYIINTINKNISDLFERVVKLENKLILYDTDETKISDNEKLELLQDRYDELLYEVNQMKEKINSNIRETNNTDYYESVDVNLN
jgi:hypothetical protein